MNTYLGAGADFDEDDVDADVAARARWLFLEGYLYDKPEGKAAFTAAARACRAGGGKVGITLSDPFCVDRHRADFLRLITDEMDYTIGNHEEWLALYQTHDLEAALEQAARVCELVVCTHSGDPVKLIRGGRARRGSGREDHAGRRHRRGRPVRCGFPLRHGDGS